MQHNADIKRLLIAYYRMVQVYVFIYNQESRESFETIKEAIERVKKVSDNKFTGFLVCNGKNGNMGEAEALARAYGLKAQEFEASTSTNELNQEILGSLNYKTV